MTAKIRIADVNAIVKYGVWTSSDALLARLLNLTAQHSIKQGHDPDHDATLAYEAAKALGGVVTYRDPPQDGDILPIGTARNTD